MESVTIGANDLCALRSPNVAAGLATTREATNDVENEPELRWFTNCSRHGIIVQ